jgi:hypothetical protein
MLLCLMPADAALAQESAYTLVAPNDVALGETTYADLLSLALPGTVATGEALTVEGDISLPHIEGPEFAVTATAPVSVGSIQSLQLSVEGRPHLALMIDLSGSEDALGPMAALALFDLGGEPALVDIKDVAFDRQSGFAEPASLSVGAGHDLILVDNSHGNAGQFYRAITIVDVVDGELDMVDMVMTLDDLGCAGSETQTVTYETQNDAAGRPDFTVTVTDVAAGPDEVCEGVEPNLPGETRYSVTYRWDETAKRYVSQGDGWAELDNLNSARY